MVKNYTVLDRTQIYNEIFRTTTTNLPDKTSNSNELRDFAGFEDVQQRIGIGNNYQKRAFITIGLMMKMKSNLVRGDHLKTIN